MKIATILILLSVHFVVVSSFLPIPDVVFQAFQWAGTAHLIYDSYLKWTQKEPYNRINDDRAGPRPGTELPPPTCRLLHNHVNRLRGLLENRVFGQHIAEPYVLAAVQSHLEDTDPTHALAMIFAGTTGTGKNFVSQMIGEALFGKEDQANFVHIYSGRSHFPNPNFVQEYRTSLQMEVRAAVANCIHSVFIFDEIDKMPEGVIDVLKPYLDNNIHVGGVDFRKSIFIFLTNVGGKEINTVYKGLKDRGVIRSGVQYSDFEKHLRRVLYESEGMFAGSEVISQYLISYFVPFLPLEMKHVKECITDAMIKYNIPKSEEKRVIDNVVDKMDFFRGEFSLSGCKRVHDHVKVEKHVKSRTIRRS